jgi:NitT/TauT family transport system ATP-binding protein
VSTIEITDLGVDYTGFGRSVTAIDGVTITIPAGDALAIIGPSGCGKSTMLYSLSGLIAPTRGTITINGEPVVGRRRQTALILQDFGLFAWKTVFNNAALGLQVRHVPKPDVREHVEDILKRLGLWEMRDRYPGQLSGGQRQRVAIARSLALEPDLLLMDEPFSSLDALTREDLQNTVLDIRRDRGTSISIVLVTHSIEEAAFLGKRIAVMGGSPGSITDVVTNDEMGGIDYRNSLGFFDHCARLRGLLKGGVCVG